MRRILLVLSAAALIVAIAAFSSVSAFAAPVCGDPVPPGPGGVGQWTVTCVETEVVTEEVSRTPTTEDCVVGSSQRQGTQEGDLVQTDEVTYKTTTTRIYQGFPSPSNENLLSETTSDPVEESRVKGEPTFEPTGPCRNIPGRQSP